MRWGWLYSPTFLIKTLGVREEFSINPQGVTSSIKEESSGDKGLEMLHGISSVR